jgi:hypothetical protein
VHEASHTVTPNFNAFASKVVDHATAACCGVFQVQGIDPSHDPQRLRINWYWLVVER